jgi:CheY-like chemotaxis protein
MSGAARREPLRALLVEDSEDDAVLLLWALDSAGFEVTHQRVENAKEMLAAVKGGPAWDVVLSDYSLPQFDAPAALEILRRHGHATTPFFVVSGSGADARAASEFEKRVAGVFVKGKLDGLAAAIRAALAR